MPLNTNNNNKNNPETVERPWIIEKKRMVDLDMGDGEGQAEAGK